MRLTRHLKPALAALVALAFASAIQRTAAQTFITQSYTNTFDTGGNTTDFSGSGSVASWLYWYNTPGGNLAMTNDVTMDAGGDPNSGSLMVYSPFAGFSPSDATQNVFFGTFGNTGGYDSSVEANFYNYTNISCDIHVSPSMTLSANGDFGSLGIGIYYPYSFVEMGSVTIPASATNGWVHLSVPVDQTKPNLATTVGIGFSYADYGGYPFFDMLFWLDNVAASSSAAPPPPPTLGNLQTPETGLNCIAVDSGSGGIYNRYQLATVNSTGYTFVGQPSVTYSWTIKSFPTNTDDNFQQHFFIVNGAPGQYDQAADYNLADCIFFEVQQNADGTAAASFRYKTNEPDGNAMLFNGASPTNSANTNEWPIMPVCTFTDVSPVGSWSLTFDNTTNVTITGPSGASTNFVLDAASAALFADPVTLLLGGQPNNVNGDGQAVVYGNFSVSGSTAPFTDDFLTDTALNTNYWKNFSSDTNGCVLVPSGSAYWLSWTLPDAGFSLQTSGNLADSNSWQALNVLQIIDNGREQALIPASALPSPGQGYFQLVQHVFSQLQVLLPGETAAPGTPTGKTGTPTPVSLGAGGYITVTVNAVDQNWNPIPGVSDSIAITSSDGSATLPLNANLANGTMQFTVQFGTQGNQTVTATDVTTPAITPNTSSPVSVTP